MFVNSTKITLPVFKIAIAWNDEDGFIILNKIIQLFRFMKINATFEPIDIAGINYQKKINYGIDESSLTHLKQTDLLIHTKFNYDFFNKKDQLHVDEYLDFATQNFFLKIFKKKNNDYDINIKETVFFKKIKSFIKNIDEINFNDKNFFYNKNEFEDFNFSFSYGKYSIFNLNKYTSYDVKNFTIELLMFLNLKDSAQFLSKFETIEDCIIDLKKNKNIFSQYQQIDKNNNFKIKFKDQYYSLPSKIDDIETTIEGIFKVNYIVNSIKEKKIKLPDEYELYQILSYNIEYYPNINFWNEYVVNPTIKLKKIYINNVLFD